MRRCPRCRTCGDGSCRSRKRVDSSLRVSSSGRRVVTVRQTGLVSTSYREAGVDTAAGDLAVELMKSAVQKTHGPEVLGGVGGFAGLFDVSFLKAFTKPLLATSTDGVGTKV